MKPLTNVPFSDMRKRRKAINLTTQKAVLLGEMKSPLSSFLRQRQGRKERMATLMAELGKTTPSYRLVSDLSEVTGLGDTVLPLLAALKKQGLVEQRWLETERGPQLAYRLVRNEPRQTTAS